MAGADAKQVEWWCSAPRVAFVPDLILPLFLPPLLFATAQRTSWAVFRARWRTIAFLTVALVAATVAAVTGTAFTTDFDYRSGT